MYFKKITIQNFKTITKLDLDLDPGLNIVFGPNEAGKSTFLEALHAALFEKADSSKAEVLRYRSWGSDADPTIRIAILADGKEYEIEKQFLGAKKGRLSCKASGLDTTNKDRINEELAKIIPLYTSDGKSLKNTSWIRQRQLEETIYALGRDADVRSALQSAIFKSDGDIEAIKSAIADKITEIGKGWERPAKYFGPLAQSKKELDQLENEVADLRAQLTSIEDDVKMQRELTDKVSALESQIKEDEEILAAAEKYSLAKKNLDQANKQLDDIQETIDRYQENEKQTSILKGQIVDVQSKLKECEDAIASIEQMRKRADTESRFRAERSLLDAVEHLQKQIEGLGSELAKLPEVSKDDVTQARSLASEIDVKKESLRASQISVEAKALSDIKVRIAEDESEQREEALKEDELKTYRANQKLRIGVPEIIELKVTSGVSDAARLQNQLDETEKSLRGLLTKYAINSVQDLAEKYDKRQQLASRSSNVKTELNAKLNSRSIEVVRMSVDSLSTELQSLAVAQPQYIPKQGETIDSGRQKRDALVKELANVSADLRQREAEAKRFLETYGDLGAASQRKKELAREAAKAEASLEETPKLELADEQIFTRKTRLQKNNAEYPELRDKLLRLSGALQRATVSSDELRLKESELAESKSVFEANLLEFEAYKVLSDTLHEAEIDVSKHFMEPIEHIVTTILPRLTAGRYSELSLNENLEINHVKFSSQEVEPDELSTGTQGQLALALRLALIEYLAGKDRQSVVLDDALVNFDAERLAEAKKLLTEFAESHQVIYLSCHPEIYHWDGAKVLEI